MQGKSVAALTLQNLDTTLAQIQGTQGFQGVSGYIAFDAQHNPVDRALVIIKLSAQGRFGLLCIDGAFFEGKDHEPYNCS